MYPTPFTTPLLTSLKNTYIHENYNIIKVIGVGAYGTIYQVSKKDNPKKVYALKYVSRHLFSQETSILLKLDHENIIKIVEAVNRLYGFIIMEKCSFDLHDYIVETQKRSLKTKLSIMYQILKGVNYLHQKKIVHRDLKPGNILIGYDNSVKITDFGFAIYYGRFRIDDFQLGTREFMAPEILLGKIHYSYSVDMWSLGCILYFLLNEQYFAGTNLFNHIHIIFRDCYDQHTSLWNKFFATIFLLKIPKNQTVKPVIEQTRKHVDCELVLDLLNGLLVLDCNKRFTINEAFKHGLFINFKL